MRSSAPVVLVYITMFSVPRQEVNQNYSAPCSPCEENQNKAEEITQCVEERRPEVRWVVTSTAPCTLSPADMTSYFLDGTSLPDN